MANKLNIQDTPISITQINDEDYISLTDMMKVKEGDFFFHNWLRNRNTVEFLGIWEKVHNPNFNSVEFDIIKSQAGLCLSNMENLNAVFINEGMPQPERLQKLNQIAIQQMTVLENVESKHILKA